jgi:hypothetical protein
MRKQFGSNGKENGNKKSERYKQKKNTHKFMLNATKLVSKKEEKEEQQQ